MRQSDAPEQLRRRCRASTAFYAGRDRRHVLHMTVLHRLLLVLNRLLRHRRMFRQVLRLWQHRLDRFLRHRRMFRPCLRHRRHLVGLVHGQHLIGMMHGQQVLRLMPVKNDIGLSRSGKDGNGLDGLSPNANGLNGMKAKVNGMEAKVHGVQCQIWLGTFCIKQTEEMDEAAQRGIMKISPETEEVAPTYLLAKQMRRPTHS